MPRMDNVRCAGHYYSIRRRDGETPEAFLARVAEAKVEHLAFISDPSKCLWVEEITKFLCPSCNADITDEAIKFSWGLAENREFDDYVLENQ